MNSKPFASIIVPTYNQASFLGQALDSLISQTDPDWEAIVVNDGSTDNTREIAEDYARRDNRIRCIHKQNGGVASALNCGLENARGEWLHWLSSDDLFEPQKLAINRRWIEQNPDVNFFFSYFTLLRDATGEKDRRDLWGPLPEPEHQILTLFYRNYVSGITICVRRSIWESIGFFDETLHYAQDYDQWLRLLQNNQGRFIPEWTVISRNHAAQGSETFPDACYFDTAKAALRFINQHTFPSLVPWANLSNSDTATKVVTYALDVACERTAFLYRLGPHPALVIRVLEWVFSEHCKLPELKSLVQNRIAQMSFVDGDDDWAWMWRQLAAAVHGDKKNYPYEPIEPIQLALHEFRSRLILGDPSYESLRNYLIRFEGVEADTKLTSAKCRSRIVFLINQDINAKNWLDTANHLAQRGFRPLIMIEDSRVETSAVQWSAQVPVIRVSTFGHDTLPWLGEVEIVITQQGNGVPSWLGGLSHFSLEDGHCQEAVEQKILGALGHGIQKPATPVAFLERVLWGGGAERVVFDIVRHMSRRRYRPIILTMFDEHTVAPKLPPGVEVYNIRHESFEGEAKVSTHNRHAPPRQARMAYQLFHGLRRVYHRSLTPEIRNCLGVGRRLVAAKEWGRLASQKLRVTNSPPRIAASEHAVNNQVMELDFINAMVHHNPASIGLAKAVRKIGNDAVLVTVMEEAAVSAWLAQAAIRFPYIASLHTLESKCLRDMYPLSARYRAEKWLLSAACNNADKITLPSQGCCQDLVENFAVSKANPQKIWNPVDCARVRWLSHQRLEPVDAWRSEASCFRMVHVGRLDPQKNHELLLATCVELKKRRQPFSLVIVGEGHARVDIEKQIHAHGLSECVKLVGEQKNPFPWIAAADALLLTSHFEAFALVLVEAMVCGTPVISVDCPTGPAEVLNNGEFGLLVPNDDPVGLADAVEHLLENPSRSNRLIELGYERASAFDVKHIVPQWEALIDTITPPKASQLN